MAQLRDANGYQLVTVGAALPAGSASIGTVVLGAGSAAVGKLAANSGVIIGDVNISAGQTIALAAGAAIIGAVTQSGTWNIGTVTAVTTVSTVTSLSQLAGQAISLGNGAVGAGTLRVTLASDSTGVVQLAAGTNGIGKLTANSGVTIGAVELAAAQTLATVTTVSTVSTVNAVVPGTGATNLGKAEDAAAGDGDTGVYALTHRKDTQASTAGTTGDYAGLTTDATGGLWTHPVATITKTQSTLYTMAETAINTVSKGTDTNVPSAATVADIRIDFAQDTTTAPASGTRLSVQTSDQTTGDDTWVEVAAVYTGTTAAESEAVTGTEAAASTVIEVASTTNLGARSELVFFKNGTLANSEWAQLVSIVSNTSITLQDGLTNAQTSSTIYDQAARYVVPLDCSSCKRVRLVVDNNYQATGPTVVVRSVITFREVA